jgi:alpha-tubulin suppressor-like RCC1 family protein
MRPAIALGMLSGLMWLSGCPDPGPDIVGLDPERPLERGVIISNPKSNAPTAHPSHAPSAGGSLATLDLTSEIVYVSLASGTYPEGATAIIEAPRVPGVITATMTNGGLDPISVIGAEGDPLQLEILRADGISLAKTAYRVPPRRRPRVVRTVPPRGKTNVPVNATIMIVFSEPVSPSTVTSATIGLAQDGEAVAGSVHLLPGGGTVAAFTPTAPLGRNAQYRLNVSPAITDLEGDTLESVVSVTFTTGEASLGPPASIRLSPDTAYLLTGIPFQLTATVTDAAGNELTNTPVWETSNPSGLSVSSTGLATPFASGNYTVIARIGDLVAQATIYVRGVPASLQVTPSAQSVPVDEAIALSAVVEDAAGFPLNVQVTWVSSAPDVARISSAPDAAMVVTIAGVAVGTADITARTGNVSGTSAVTVSPRRAVGSVTVNPASATLILGDTVRVFAAVNDFGGVGIPGRPVFWASDNPAVATVDGIGRVTAMGHGTANVTATSEGVSGAVAITVSPLVLASMSATYAHTCGLTPEGAAYCWGRLTPLGEGNAGSRARPVKVPGGLEFVSIAAGMTHSCGLTAAGSAYCWGNGDAGQLGDGTGEHSYSDPVLVIGGLTFKAITAGGPHTCGLTTEGQAYCWGANTWGQLGDGATRPFPSLDERRFAPTPVAGGLTFTALSAGKADHTCGLTPTGDAYCWGRGDFGKLGAGTAGHFNAPVHVQSSVPFVSVTAGFHHGCGLTAIGDVYCWGGAGLGYGLPSRVAGGFIALSAGSSHTCGLPADGSLQCWGFNEEGRLGDGTTTAQLAPTPVIGGLIFSSVTSGGAHTCGLTTDQVAYCWGWNEEGQLGNGSTSNSLVPVKVLGQR